MRRLSGPYLTSNSNIPKMQCVIFNKHNKIILNQGSNPIQNQRTYRLRLMIREIRDWLRRWKERQELKGTDQLTEVGHRAPSATISTVVPVRALVASSALRWFSASKLSLFSSWLLHSIRFQINSQHQWRRRMMRSNRCTRLSRLPRGSWVRPASSLASSDASTRAFSCNRNASKSPAAYACSYSGLVSSSAWLLEVRSLVLPVLARSIYLIIPILTATSITKRPMFIFP